MAFPHLKWLGDRLACLADRLKLEEAVKPLFFASPSRTGEAKWSDEIGARHLKQQLMGGSTCQLLSLNGWQLGFE